jgi:Asp/Glu/hydantoin racemase
MTQTLAMIHTGPVVIAPFKALAAQHLPGVRIVNYLDDRIVADIEGSDGIPDSVRTRLALLGKAAVESGADAILFTCSSVSQLAKGVEDAVGIPVYRVDEAMADAAVAAGTRIGVIATLPTTLGPTCELIEERASLTGAEISIERVLAREAFDLVSSGDGAGHDRVVREAIAGLADKVDVVVLAQASMARALDGFDPGVPVLSSPELGVLRTQQALRSLSSASPLA